MKPAKRRDPSARRHILAPFGKRLLHIGEAGRVLQDRVVARPVVDADDVAVRLDEAGKDGLAAEVDRPRRTRGHCGRLRADCNEAASLDRHRVGDGIGAVHRVDAAIDQNQIRSPTGTRATALRQRRRARKPRSRPPQP